MTKAEIQLVRSLTDKRSRTEHGLFVAEGHKFIGELRTSALRVRKIFALEGLFEGGEVETVSPREMERLSLLKTPSGQLITSSAQVKKGDLIEGILASGRMVAQVVGATNPAPPADTPDTGA